MTIEALPAEQPKPPAAPGVRSPLNRRQSLVLLATLVAATVALFGAVVLTGLLAPGAREAITTVLAVALPLHAVILLAMIHRALRRAGTGWRELGFTRPTRRILHLLWQIPAVLAALISAQMLALAITGNTPGYQGGGVASLGVGAGPFVALMVFTGAAVLTPVWEEAVFRGVIHGGLRRRFGWLSASLISAALFAAGHGIPVLLPYMITLGLSLAFLREFHKTLWAPVIMHACLNGLVTGAVLLA